MLVFRATGTHYIANLNFFEFVGDGLQPERTPTLTLPSGVTGTAGVPVTYAASATDPYDGALPVTCSPASGTPVVPVTPLGRVSVGVRSGCSPSPTNSKKLMFAM